MVRKNHVGETQVQDDNWGPPAIVRLSPSRPRIYIGVGVLICLGLLVLEIAVTGVFGLGTRLLTLVISAAIFLLALRLWMAGKVELEFADGLLREAGQGGREIARAGNIHSVDRGVFAFKPSNGFLIRLHTGASRVWMPGIWWRLGRRVGVGGLIPAHQTKLVAELISMEIARGDEAKNP